MKKQIFIVLTCLILGACVTNTGQQLDLASKNKSVTVSGSNSRLNALLKRGFQADGWRLVSLGDKGKNLKPDSEPATFRNFATSYTLLVSSERLRVCDKSDPTNWVVEFETVLIENETGNKILSFSGLGCENSMSSLFTKRLRIMQRSA